jgi:hypothetical protein
LTRHRSLTGATVTCVVRTDRAHAPARGHPPPTGGHGRQVPLVNEGGPRQQHPLIDSLAYPDRRRCGAGQVGCSRSSRSRIHERTSVEAGRRLAAATLWTSASSSALSGREYTFFS